MASNLPKKDSAILYIARDIERALGKEPVGNYFVITNNTPYSREIQSRYPDNIFIIKSSKTLDTHELIQSDEVQKIISKHNPQLVVFKNTSQIENICKEKGLILLNPSAELAEKIENKISQVKWLGDLSTYLPPHKILLAKDISWEKNPFVLQWSHGHTGDGTILVQNEKILDDLKEKFPIREARITNFIKGPMFTVNIVVSPDKILLGNISYQITGILPFTENVFSTIGNDWSVTHTILTDIQINHLEKIAHKIGEKMQKENWKGLFGIDVIYDEERDKVHLIEINARQPASTTFESELQSNLRSQGVPGITTFEAHLLALENISVDQDLILINDGAQILQRVTSLTNNINGNKLIDEGYKVIKYLNTKPNSDLLRIQSQHGIMETHTKFNKRGKQIVELLAD